MEGLSEPFLWLSVIPFLKELPNHVATAIVIIMLIIIAAFFASRKLSSSPRLIPEARLTFLNFFEIVIEKVLDLMEGVMGHHAKRFLPLIGTLAMFIFFSNISGLIPGFLPPTDTINTTAAFAIIVFLTTHYVGIKEHGTKYIKHFTGPFWWLSPIMLPIELISHFVRPVSLSLRLFGNITGDHLVLSIFILLVPQIIPISMMVVGLFVAILQTFVFILLSMIYITGAVEHAEH